MDAAEVEFLAEKELVTIIPNFSLDKIYLIGGDLGPFSPGLPVVVPLWLAINLKQRQKCRLIPPEWMDVEKLEKIRDHERKEETFTPMPSPYYMELTKLLLNQKAVVDPRGLQLKPFLNSLCRCAQRLIGRFSRDFCKCARFLCRGSGTVLVLQGLCEDGLLSTGLARGCCLPSLVVDCKPLDDNKSFDL
nr:DNA replication complex GINS protein PSF2 isoform X1 [Manis javanica]